MSSSLLTGGIPISTWSAHESGSNQSCLQKSRVMSSLFGALKGKFPSGLVFPSSFSVYPFSITSLVFVLFFFKHKPWGLPLDWQSKNYDTKENFDGFHFCLNSFFFMETINVMLTAETLKCEETNPDPYAECPHISTHTQCPQPFLNTHVAERLDPTLADFHTNTSPAPPGALTLALASSASTNQYVCML